MILEGPMIILATLVLTVLHPGLAFGGNWGAAAWSLGKGKDAHLDGADRVELKSSADSS